MTDTTPKSPAIEAPFLVAASAVDRLTAAGVEVREVKIDTKPVIGDPAPRVTITPQDHDLLPRLAAILDLTERTTGTPLRVTDRWFRAVTYSATVNGVRVEVAGHEYVDVTVVAS